MAVAANILIATIGFWLLCCIVISVFGRRVNHVYASAALYLGGAALLLTAITGWANDTAFVIGDPTSTPIFLAVAPLTLRIDALSSIFIALLAVLTMAVALFSPGYLPHLDKKCNPGAYWVQLILFVIGMLGVLVAANAPTFLLNWELMALSSALLVATNLSSQDARRAAFIYLGATRIATAFLMAGFFWMYSFSASWDFKDWQLDSPATLVPCLFMLVAFCIKGGIWPFHEWLPYAHPSAPAPVSALMSGVMIKVAAYAMIRIFIMGGLGKKMPITMLFFVIGSAAICSLPPLNGFSSKWLIYQSLFHLAHRSGSLWLGGMAVACMAILGLVSGMSLYCLLKPSAFLFRQIEVLRRRLSHRRDRIYAGQSGISCSLLCLSRTAGTSGPQYN